MPGRSLLTLDRLVDAIARSRTTVVFTGAGISTASGIPDFRSPSGLGLAHEEVAHLSVLEDHPELFWTYYRSRYENLAACRPNPAHDALAQLEAAGILQTVVTQNVDGFHQLAGSREVIELHGTFARIPCTRCEHVSSRDELSERFDAAGVARCPQCAGVLRPGVVLFGERLPAGAIERCYELAYDADLLICIGSSLRVRPASNMPVMARRGNTTVAIINQGRTGFGTADIRIGADASTVLPAVAKRVLAS